MPGKGADAMGESRDRAATLARGYAALGAGDAVGARACFASMRAVDAADPDALHGLACVALAAGRPDLAISLAGRALRHAPGGIIMSCWPARYWRADMGMPPAWR